MADKRVKGREVYPASGALHWKAKLTKTQADDIRNGNGIAREYAAQYGISISTVYDIRKNRSWRQAA